MIVPEIGETAEVKLSRQQRRQLERKADKEKTAMVCINRAQYEADLEAAKKEAVDKATLAAIVQTVVMPTLALRDEFGFGRERLLRFARRAIGWFEALEYDGLELEDAKQTLYDETGIWFEDHGDGRLTVHVPEEGDDGM